MCRWVFPDVSKEISIFYLEYLTSEDEGTTSLRNVGTRPKKFHTQKTRILKKHHCPKLCTHFFLTHAGQLTHISQVIPAEKCRLSVCNLFLNPVNFPILGKNISITPSSNTSSLSSSLNVTDQAAHPHKKTGKIIVL